MCVWISTAAWKTETYIIACFGKRSAFFYWSFKSRPVSCRRTHCEEISQFSHASFSRLLFSEWSHLNGGVSGMRIKPCFSPYSEAAVCADNGPAVEKNGALQCVVSVANPHDSLLTIIAWGWEGFQAAANTAGACSAMAHCVLTKKGCIFNLSPLKPLQPPAQSARHQNNIQPLVLSMSLLVDGDTLCMLNMVFTSSGSVLYQLWHKYTEWMEDLREQASQYRHFFLLHVVIQPLVQGASTQHALSTSCEHGSVSSGLIITATGNQMQPPHLSWS